MWVSFNNQINKQLSRFVVKNLNMDVFMTVQAKIKQIHAEIGTLFCVWTFINVYTETELDTCLQ